MNITALYHPPTFTLTYVVWDEVSKDAIIIDPVLDFDPAAWQTSTTSTQHVIDFVRAHDLELHYVLETHAHADHLSGSQHLKHELGGRIAISEQITVVQKTFRPIFDLGAAFPVDGSQFDLLLSDGQTFEAGSLSVEVIATPGHTPACVTYRIGDAVFTGDALFMDDYGTGRCDFPRGSAADLYNSLTKLYALPDSTRVFVGHDYQPGGRALAYETTIGASKRNNPYMRAETTKDEFVAQREARDKKLSAPKLLFQSVQVNINAGLLPDPSGSGIRHLHIPVNLFGPTDATGKKSS